VHIHNNLLTTLPRWFTRFVTPDIMLDLSGNRFTTIPEILCSCIPPPPLPLSPLPSPLSHLSIRRLVTTASLRELDLYKNTLTAQSVIRFLDTHASIASLNLDKVRFTPEETVQILEAQYNRLVRHVNTLRFFK